MKIYSIRLIRFNKNYSSPKFIRLNLNLNNSKKRKRMLISRRILLSKIHLILLRQSNRLHHKISLISLIMILLINHSPRLYKHHPNSKIIMCLDNLTLTSHRNLSINSMKLDQTSQMIHLPFLHKNLKRKIIHLLDDYRNEY